MTVDTERPLLLVADDDEDILALVEFRLAREGYRILTAPDGEVAVRLARQHQPDVAILDVRMPKLDGYEVTEQIRRSEAVSVMPVILLSASVEDMHIQRGYDAGANHYMHKPFSPQDLVEHVASALREGPAPDKAQTASE